MAEEVADFIHSIGWKCEKQTEDVEGVNRLKCNHEDTGRTMWFEESGDIAVGDKNTETDINTRIEHDQVNNRLNISKPLTPDEQAERWKNVSKAAGGENNGY